MMIYVQYQDHSWDVVDAHTLDKLIAGKGPLTVLPSIRAKMGQCLPRSHSRVRGRLFGT